MTQCVAKTRAGSRCRMEADEGHRECPLHEGVPLHYEEIGRLKQEASAYGHVVISRSSYTELLNDRERLKQKEREESRGRPVGWGT